MTTEQEKRVDHADEARRLAKLTEAETRAVSQHRCLTIEEARHLGNLHASLAIAEQLKQLNENCEEIGRQINYLTAGSPVRSETSHLEMEG